MTEQYIKNLNVPAGKVDVVIDTDTFNEIDDQFAISYLLASSDKLNLKALYAAPFFNSHSESPKDGMEKSYDEILRLLELTGRQEFIPVTYKGSEDYLPDENTPVVSDAARNLIERAMTYSPEAPLYVIAIGAITNVASALLLNPEIAERLVIVWLGGHGREYHNNKEFNLIQDVAAARVLFKSGAPVVQLPCKGVVSEFSVSVAEMERYLLGKNALCDFLVKRVKDEVASYAEGLVVSRVLWDVTTVAWLLNDNDRFMLTRLASLPVPEYDGLCAYDHSRLIQYVYHINRDQLVTDLFMKLTAGKCFD
ncbi:MAG: nucleoside hydrolase [Lachnospiraceae bacterium]|nr:nucleoside hydrolase [Lachnospiraceae bacterium]